MKRLTRTTVIGLIASGLLAFAVPSTGFAAPNSTMKGALPKGKPFQYLNSRIDALQAQINLLIGRVDSLEAWQVSAQQALVTLQQDTAKNAAAIALLTSEIDNIKAILASKQDIINGECPAGQYVYAISQNPATLVCRADIGANGLQVYTVETTADIAATTAAVISATCPTGTVPTGGSYSAAPGLTVNSAGITSTGYAVDVANTTGGSLTVNVTATCLGVAS